MPNRTLSRSLVFLIVAGLHAAALFLIVVAIETTRQDEELPPEVMRLVDVMEEEPPPPPEEAVQNVTNTVTENVIATDEAPPPPSPARAATVQNAAPAEEYVSQNKISVVPRFDDGEITARLVYPPLALRANVEGSVILELFINKLGFVTRIRILKETPEGRGFGEAAVRAFTGLRATPAEANGQPASVRYRYPVRFQLR